MGHWIIVVFLLPLMSPLKLCFLVLQYAVVVAFGFVKLKCCLDALTIIQFVTVLVYLAGN